MPRTPRLLALAACAALALLSTMSMAADKDKDKDKDKSKDTSKEKDHDKDRDKETRRHRHELLRTVDAQQNCIFLGAQQIPEEHAVKVPLRSDYVYTVDVTGRAFLSDQRGSNADPMPGVVIFYCTNEENDGFATKYKVVAPNERLAFRTPRNRPENTFLLAFFLDYWPDSENRGSYDLTITGERSPEGGVSDGPATSND